MIRNLIRYGVLYLCLSSMIACAQTPAASAPKLETDDQKTLYALGLLLGGNIKTLDTPALHDQKPFENK